LAKKIVDARKLACPEPVMQTMKAMSEADEVMTIVGNEAARENVAQLAKGQGWDVEIVKKDDGIYLNLKKGTQVKEGPKVPVKGVVVLIASESLGRGELVQLGSLLMQSFLHTLNGLLTKPETIIFINSGVKLVTIDSLVLEDLRRLKETGG
jgi:selenium metabolism protein YedF